MGEWLLGKRGAVGPDPVALLQGYPFTGFVRVTDEGLDFPPAWAEAGRSVDWELYWDVRLFGGRGEIHCWRRGRSGWHWRLLAAGGEGADLQLYPLWGERDAARAVPGWECYWETRGAEIWVPAEHAKGRPELSLQVRRRVEPDPTSGLAGVVDAGILCFGARRAEKELR